MMQKHKAEPQEVAAVAAGRDTRRRPFDSRDLDSLPRPERHDPPYRAWWVVEPKDGE